MAAAGNLLVAQGGGPTPVINCSLYGVIREARSGGRVGRLLGGRFGIAGVLRGDVVDLADRPESEIEGLKRSPGAGLGSCRYKVKPEDCGRLVERLRTLGVRYFLYIGGNDSMDTAHQVHQVARREGHELFVIGVPKTIDNDLPLTDHCPGYGSAARYVAQSVRDLGADVGSLPPRVSVFEAMGRNTGWLAAAAALAKDGPDSAPHLVYVPERPFRLDRFFGEVEAVARRLNWALVVVSEGIRGPDGAPVHVAENQGQTDGFGHTPPGGVGSYLAGELSAKLKIRSRSEKPGLCGRASILCASPVDQAEAEAVGRAAVRAALAGESDRMVTLARMDGPGYGCATGLAPLAEVANVERFLPDAFLGADGSSVMPAFLDYARPLVGGELLSYVSLLR